MLIILFLWGIGFSTTGSELRILPDTPINMYAEKPIHRLFKIHKPHIRASPIERGQEKTSLLTSITSFIIGRPAIVTKL